jgi:hypothetical protein
MQVFGKMSLLTHSLGARKVGPMYADKKISQESREKLKIYVFCCHFQSDKYWVHYI